MSANDEMNEIIHAGLWDPDPEPEPEEEAEPPPPEPTLMQRVLSSPEVTKHTMKYRTIK